MNRNTLSLDLGTRTGYAIRLRGGDTFSGTKNFTLKKNDHTVLRWINFRTWLTDVLVRYNIHAVVYEEVRRHSATRASHVYGGFKAILEMSCYAHNCELAGFGVGPIKKFATGKGNASKHEMMAAIDDSVDLVDDNHADALHLLNYALSLEAD